MTYHEYMDEVYNIMTSTCGLGPMDIADYLWRDAFENEVPVREAIREALENEGAPEEVIDLFYLLWNS